MQPSQSLAEQLEQDDLQDLFSVQKSPEAQQADSEVPKDDFLQKFKTNGRYFEAPSPLVKCFNCGEFGHMAGTCPNPCSKVRCVYCGQLGHTAFNCEDVICHSCKGVGHKISNCPYRRMRMERCYICERTGHKAKECMARDDPVTARQVSQFRCLNCGVRTHVNCYVLESFSKSVYCCRCGERGHEGANCRSRP